MAAVPTIVCGYITRLFPGGDRLYFHVSGDQSPYDYTGSGYSFILYSDPHYQATYQLLLKGAEHKWAVIVKRSDSMQKHVAIDTTWAHYNADYAYVDF